MTTFGRLYHSLLPQYWWQAGKYCLCKGTVISLWKQLEFLLVSWVHSALQHTQNLQHYASPNLYTDQPIKQMMSVNWGLCLSPHWQSYSHLARPGLFSSPFLGWGICPGVPGTIVDFHPPILCIPWNMQTVLFYFIHGYILTSWWIYVICVNISFNSSPPGQNGHYFGRWQFQMHFFYKSDRIRFEFHWNLFPEVQLTISQHWFR